MTPPVQRRAIPSFDPRPLRDVLVVDDLPEIGTMCRQLLRRVRAVRVHTVVEVHAQRAMKLLERQPFDLIVTDLRMPDGSGDEVVRAARRLAPQTPVVLMSGHLDHVRVLPDGLAGILTKPFNLPRSLGLFEELLTAEGQHRPPAVSAPAGASNTDGATEPPHGREGALALFGGDDPARAGR